MDEPSTFAEPCEHFYVSWHEPEHLVYWVRICHLCQRPDWDDLDKQIKELKRSDMEDKNPGEVPFTSGLNYQKNQYRSPFQEPAQALPKLTDEELKQYTTAVHEDVFFDPNATYQDRARQLVYAYVKSRLEKTDTHVTFGHDEVYVVWFCKTLANWKALLSTTLPDGMYYEVTHDGVACYDYIDAYKKFENIGVPEGADPRMFLR